MIIMLKGVKIYDTSAVIAKAMELKKCKTYSRSDQQHHTVEQSLSPSGCETWELVNDMKGWLLSDVTGTHPICLLGKMLLTDTFAIEFKG